jgi:hypothetical protein
MAYQQKSSLFMQLWKGFLAKISQSVLKLQILTASNRPPPSQTEYANNQVL